ncbi:MAG: carboxylating nicotinate-nucleotide diphosphorylase [Candidatus Omnitrophota bacterium]|nr:carboxylating nicotinate-nucleotide diphosphorylase [Candidatus Omnitrophota bacterium]MBU1929219.1 carboxylating nicotinate-nucleotide diphosphorylase [Candidatus Omnitrophota bacterium]
MALDKLDPRRIDCIVKQALVEDIGKGDITTQLTIPKDKHIKGTILSNEDCVICGLDVMETVFKTVDKNVIFSALIKEGHKIKKGKVIGKVEGRAQSILSAERVGLNLLSLLSSVATKTREYVEKIEPLKVKISDTRKTIPGLRELQKYAVRVGGGHNHRMGLDEMVLIKDNHIKVIEGYSKLPSVPKGFKIEIEVTNLDEFNHALKFKPDFIMLDNMNIPDMKKAVEILNATLFNSHHPRTKLEASGGVDLDNIKEIASTGVDIISIGDLTHSVQSVDISLEVE